MSYLKLHKSFMFYNVSFSSYESGYSDRATTLWSVFWRKEMRGGSSFVDIVDLGRNMRRPRLIYHDNLGAMNEATAKIRKSSVRNCYPSSALRCYQKHQWFRSPTTYSVQTASLILCTEHGARPRSVRLVSWNVRLDQEPVNPGDTSCMYPKEN